MAVTKNTIQGKKFSWNTETALATEAAVGLRVDFRPETFEFPHKESQAYIPESGGHTNPADVNKAIPFKDGSGTGSMSMVVRRATAALEPSVGVFLKAGGWTMAKLTGSTTVKEDTTATDLIYTADAGAVDGSFVLVETTDDRFEPVHCASYVAVGTHSVPVFAMSEDPTDGNIIQQMHTYYPQTGTLAATESLTFAELSRATDGTPAAQEWVHGGCSCVLKTITIEPNKPWLFEFEVLIADTDIGPKAWAVEVDHEVDGVAMINNDFEFLIETANAAGAGGMARTSMGIRKVTIDTGVTAEKITSVGGSTDVNSVGGYTIKTVPPTWTVDGWFDVDWIDAWKTEFIEGTGTNPGIALMASSASQDYLLYPAIAVSSPLCYLVDAPDVMTEGTDSGLVEMSLQFTATGAGLNAGDGPTAAADQAIYVGISGYVAGA